MTRSNAPPVHVEPLKTRVVFPFTDLLVNLAEGLQAFAFQTTTSHDDPSDVTMYAASNAVDGNYNTTLDGGSCAVTGASNT